MTERLKELLHEQGDALTIPPLDHRSIIGEGRRMRTRRRTGVVLGAAAALAVIGGGAAVAVNGLADDAPADRTATAQPPGMMAYGAGSTVVVDGSSATVPDTVHSLHYTSLGVLVRSNPNDGASDGSGPESLTLVEPNGSTTSLGKIPEGVGPATDPDEPVYALAEKDGDGFRAVVRDASTGEEVGSVELPDLPMSYWPVPPLALDGDIVYAGFKNEAVAFDWRTGEQKPADGLSGGIPEVHGGHVVVEDGSGVTVVDAATGEVALTVPTGKDAFADGRLSPDGDYLQVQSLGGMVDPKAQSVPDPTMLVYDVTTKAEVPLKTEQAAETGWTTDGQVFFVNGDEVEVCAPTTGECTTQTGPPVGNDLRFGGNIYES